MRQETPLPFQSSAHDVQTITLMNFMNLDPMLSHSYLVWPRGMQHCHIKPVAFINTHLIPAEDLSPLAHLDAFCVIRVTDTWALSNLSVSLHPLLSVLCPITMEVVLFCVNYHPVDGHVLPFCSQEVKFSISWASLGWALQKSHCSDKRYNSS